MPLTYRLNATMKHACEALSAAMGAVPALAPVAAVVAATFAATFTLLAWAFAFAFSVCQHWIPGSFVATSEGDFRTWTELLYLSFSLLSGVGLSDVVPVLPQARALVMLEQFSGVMYVALVVSRLVGLTIHKAGKK